VTSLAVDIAGPATKPFTITTTRCDKSHAHLRLRGAVDAGAAPVLRAVLEGHQRAGRQYLRVDVGAAILAQAAVDVLCDLHRRLLATGGTLIITAVAPALEPVLAAADPSLLTLAATAADVSA
jgi:anti-anti-sigma regulatory factor